MKKKDKLEKDMEKKDKLKKDIASVKKKIIMYDKLMGNSFKINPKKLTNFTIQFHKLKKKILQLELVIKSEILDNDKDKFYLRLQHEIDFLQKNIKTLEDYCWRWNEAHQTVSIDMFTICTIFLWPISLLFSYYGIDFRSEGAGFKPFIKTNNWGIFLIITVSILIIGLFLRSDSIQSKIRTLVFDLPKDQRLNEIIA